MLQDLVRTVKSKRKEKHTMATAKKGGAKKKAAPKKAAKKGAKKR